MREIKTNKFEKKQADLITHPPVPEEVEDVTPLCKKKKKIYQLGREIEVFEDNI